MLPTGITSPVEWPAAPSGISRHETVSSGVYEGEG
jgi:hypothetical protein